MSGPFLPSTVTEVRRCDLGDAVVALAWSATGHLSATTAAGEIIVLDPVRVVAARLPVAGTQCWDPTGETLAIADRSGLLGIYAGSAWHDLDQLGCWVTRLAWSPAGVLAAASNNQIHLYGGDGVGTSKRQLPGLPGVVMALCWLDETYLCAATVRGTWVVDSRDGERRPVGHLESCGLSLARAASGGLAVGQAGGRVVLRWPDEEEFDLEGYGAPLWQIGWNGLGGTLAAVADGEVVAWRAPAPNRVARKPTIFSEHEAEVICLATAGVTTLLASADSEGTVLVWTPGKDGHVWGRWDSTTPIRCAAWSPGGEVLVVGTDDGLHVLELDVAHSLGSEPVTGHPPDYPKAKGAGRGARAARASTVVASDLEPPAPS